MRPRSFEIGAPDLAGDGTPSFPVESRVSAALALAELHQENAQENEAREVRTSSQASQPVCHHSGRTVLDFSITHPPGIGCRRLICCGIWATWTWGSSTARQSCSSRWGTR